MVDKGISGVCKVEISGEVEDQSLNISGVESYEAKELLRKNCKKIKITP